MDKKKFIDQVAFGVLPEGAKILERQEVMYIDSERVAATSVATIGCEDSTAIFCLELREYLGHLLRGLREEESTQTLVLTTLHALQNFFRDLLDAVRDSDEELRFVRFMQRDRFAHLTQMLQTK